MPKGVFVRTKPAWNKGIYSFNLLARVKHIISIIDNKLTVKELYLELVASGDLPKGRPGYRKLNRQLVLARRTGELDAALIREGRGRTNHQRYHPPGKFNVGDKVRIDRHEKRNPQWLREGLRIDSCRTIVEAYHTGRFVSYYLGTNSLNNNNLDSYSFRSGQLIPFESGNIGRPNHKRAYNRYQEASIYD